MYLFAHPARLWLLVALIPCAAWVARGSARRLRDWSALGQSGQPASDGAFPWVAAMLVLVLALAQPRWGRIFGRDAQSGHDVVLLVDVSRSMAAEDAVPDRMGVALESAASLLRSLGRDPGNRAAVVAFAGRGVVRCPLTEDLAAAVDALRGLRPGDVQPGGTDLGAGLEAALTAFDDEEHAEGRTVVVFTDGEDHAGTWPAAVDRLRLDGVQVHAVAIGDPDREHPVPRREPDVAKAGLKPPDSTRRSDVALAALVKATGGVIVPLGLDSADLGSLYRDRIEPMARRNRESLQPPERVERFPAFVLGALGIGLVGSWPGLTRARRHRQRYAPAVLALALAGLGFGADPGAASPARLVAEGLAEYQAGRFAKALDAFQKAGELAPGAAVPRYNAASALFRLRRHPEAIARYTEARERADPGLTLKIDYALGNARLVLGDFAGALSGYDACLASTGVGPGADSVRRDAAVNRAYAVARLKTPPDEPDRGEARAGGPNRPRPAPGKGRPGGEGAESSPSAGPTNPGGGEPPSGGGSRGAGGAGGPGQAPPEEGSPQARLNAALREIRESRRSRPPDPAPKTSGGVAKDW